MAHEISINLSTKVVANKDVEVEVKTDEGKLGTLLISKGNVEWVPVGNKVNKHRLTWARLASLMENEGRLVKIQRKTAR